MKSVFCNCKNPQPEEIKRSVKICLECEKEIWSDTDNHEEYEECDMLPDSL